MHFPLWVFKSEYFQYRAAKSVHHIFPTLPEKQEKDEILVHLLKYIQTFTVTGSQLLEQLLN